MDELRGGEASPPRTGKTVSLERVKSDLGPAVLLRDLTWAVLDYGTNDEGDRTSLAGSTDSVKPGRRDKKAYVLEPELICISKDP